MKIIAFCNIFYEKRNKKLRILFFLCNFAANYAYMPMKTNLHNLFIVLVSVLLMVGNVSPVAAQSYKQSSSKSASSSSKSAQQKAAEKKKKEAAKKKAAAAKEKAKAQADREKAQAQRQRELDEKEKARLKREKKLYNQDLHFVSIWGGAGYSGMVNQYQSSPILVAPVAGTSNTLLNDGQFSSKFIGGGGGMLGVGYEFHRQNFMMKLGPEFRIFSSQDRFSFLDAEGKNSAFYCPQVDYPEYITQYYTVDKMRETQTVGQIMLPIMFGMNIQEKAYFLAGVKVGYTFMDLWNHKGTLSTTLTDSWAVSPEWKNLTSHFVISDASFAQHPLYGSEGRGKNKMAQGLDAAISVEGGIYLNEYLSPDWQARNADSDHPWLIRLGAFLDYGMPIQRVKTSDEASFLSTNMVPMSNGGTLNSLCSQSVHASNQATSKLSSLLVGVKLTASWQVNKPKQPNPRLIMQVRDQFTGKPIAASKISVQPEGSKRKPQIKTMRRDGSFTNRYPAGNYVLIPQAEGYLDGAPRLYEHATDMLGDTVVFTLIPKPLLTVMVHDKNTEQLIAANLSLVSNEHGDSVMASTTVTDPAKIGLQYGDTYRVRISANGYHSDTASITDLYATNNYYLTPIVRVRRVLILKNMYFATDKTDILPTSDPELEKLYNFLAENPRIRVMITGHTDSQGSDTYNQRLSEGRAASVKAEMVKRGIAEDRLETNGKGESEPIDTNDTEEGRQNNRRIEVTVLNAEDATVDEY